MKYEYNEEQVELGYLDIEDIVNDIVGGSSFNLVDNFEEYARERIEEAVEENDGTDEDYDEAMEDMEKLTVLITENVREQILDHIETIRDNLSDAVYDLENY